MSACTKRALRCTPGHQQGCRRLGREHRPPCLRLRGPASSPGPLSGVAAARLSWTRLVHLRAPHCWFQGHPRQPALLRACPLTLPPCHWHCSGLRPWPHLPLRRDRCLPETQAACDLMAQLAVATVRSRRLQLQMGQLALHPACRLLVHPSAVSAANAAPAAAAAGLLLRSALHVLTALSRAQRCAAARVTTLQRGPVQAQPGRRRAIQDVAFLHPAVAAAYPPRQVAVLPASAVAAQAQAAACAECAVPDFQARRFDAALKACHWRLGRELGCHRAAAWLTAQRCTHLRAHEWAVLPGCCYFEGDGHCLHRSRHSAA